MDAPNWAYKDRSTLLNYFTSDKIRIFVIEGLEHNWHILKHFKPTDYIFVLIPCYFEEWNFNYGMKCLQFQNPNIDKQNVIWICNTNENVETCIHLKLNYVLSNQNCFLNEDVFKIKNDTNRVYNAVLNCRPENWKRPYLAKEIKNLAVLKGSNIRTKDYYDLNLLNPQFINNDRRLNEAGVVNIYGQSKVGLIFSEKEGACYSSSEYLLAGLPVISTKSEGGRDIWYNEKNSIICKANEDSVLECVNEAIEKLESGYFNREEIRQMHINQSLIYRQNFIEKVDKIFVKHNITDDSKAIFNRNFKKYHRMKKGMKTNDAISILKNDYKQKFIYMINKLKSI